MAIVRLSRKEQAEIIGNYPFGFLIGIVCMALIWKLVSFLTMPLFAVISFITIIFTSLARDRFFKFTSFLEGFLYVFTIFYFAAIFAFNKLSSQNIGWIYIIVLFLLNWALPFRFIFRRSKYCKYLDVIAEVLCLVLIAMPYLS